MSKSFTFLVVVLLISSSCKRVSNPVDRNKIGFDVELDSIVSVMQKLNTKFQNYESSTFIYGITHDMIFFIDNSDGYSEKFGSIKDISKVYSNLINKKINFFSKQDLEFVQFLFQNSIHTCRKVGENFIYEYKSDIYMADRQYNLERFIVLTTNRRQINNLLEDRIFYRHDSVEHNLGYKIIDQKENLYLLSWKNANIWYD